MIIRSACVRTVPFLLSILVFASIVEAHSITKEVTSTYPLKADGSIDLSNINGTVHILSLIHI